MTNKILGLIGGFLASNKWFTVRLLCYRNKSIRIVYYHMISDIDKNYYFKNKAITKTLFQQQIDFFKKHYTIVSMQQALDLIDNEKDTKNILVISFDDGFKENFTTIYPILKKNNILGTFFLISNCIDNKDLMWRNKLLLINKSASDKILNAVKKLSEEYKIPLTTKNFNLLNWSLSYWDMRNKENYVNYLWKLTMPYSLEEFLDKEKPYMSSNEIKILSSEGHEIGSHSISHPAFSKLDYDDFKHEISQSSKIIGSIINKKINKFSYPFGRVSPISFESRYKKEFDENFIFFGTKNRLDNFNIENRIQRDNVEHHFNVMLFRFALLPIFRKLKNFV